MRIVAAAPSLGASRSRPPDCALSAAIAHAAHLLSHFRSHAARRAAEQQQLEPLEPVNVVGEHLPASIRAESLAQTAHIKIFEKVRLTSRSSGEYSKPARMSSSSLGCGVPDGTAGVLLPHADDEVSERTRR